MDSAYKEGEEKTRKCKEGVAGILAKAQRRTRSSKKREGSTT